LKYLRKPIAKNFETLRKLSTESPSLLTYSECIQRSYAMYRQQQGCPSSINPIGLNKSTREFLKERYESPAKKYGLNWIKKLRDNHELAYCPMCGSATVKTLEHYLPKANYPEFYIFSLNLIPSCSTCNQKRSNNANAPGSPIPLLHPYFDSDILDRGFLFTEITPPYEAPMFLPIFDNAQITGITRDRVQRHITKSVDRNAFHAWSKNQWTEWKTKANRESSLNSFLTLISQHLSDHVQVSGQNTWTAAFLRGLHANHNAANWLMLNP
jgi:hypothetical protein